MGRKTFWIEEKLDGERIQLHKRGREFRFFSRKAKDYTYLYGSSFDDTQSSLTRHLKDAFAKGCEEYYSPRLPYLAYFVFLSCFRVILDGEMIAWDPVSEAVIPFGNLKTAAKEEKGNRFSAGNIHPLCIPPLTPNAVVLTWRYRI